jgi:hypothetical protein
MLDPTSDNASMAPPVPSPHLGSAQHGDAALHLLPPTQLGAKARSRRVFRLKELETASHDDASTSSAGPSQGWLALGMHILGCSCSNWSLRTCSHEPSPLRHPRRLMVPVLKLICQPTCCARWHRIQNYTHPSHAAPSSTSRNSLSGCIYPLRATALSDHLPALHFALSLSHHANRRCV